MSNCIPGQIHRQVLLVDCDGNPIDGANPLPISGGGGPGTNVTVVDIEDGAGSSVMDAVNDAIRVNIVAGGTGGGVITDIEDGAGDSVMDAVNDAIRVIAVDDVSPSAPAYSALTTTGEVTLIAAPGVGLSIWVTDMTGSNEGSLNTRMDLKEGAGGTVRYSYVMAKGGGGFAHSLRTPWKLPANTALVAKLSAASTSYVTVNYDIRA